jgi:hypothetical protein
MKRFPVFLAISLFTLVIFVSCGGGGSGSSGSQNEAPLADAGNDFISLRNNLVILDGSGCSDPEGDPLTYSWSFTTVPSGSTATLNSASTETPMFTADRAGNFIVNLVVNDGGSDSQADSVTIKVLSSVSSLPDTGLSSTYDNTEEIPFPSPGQVFYGQDAQYSTNPMMYTDNGDTVTDLVTGLMWQKEDDNNTYNWYEASGTYDATFNPSTIDYCGPLTLGSFTDWRLPSKRELVSIIDYGNYSRSRINSPSINTLYFINTDENRYWTNDLMVNSGDPPSYWSANFSTGRVPGAGVDVYVRCVRGSSWGINDFVDNGDGTVTDNMSGLVWQQADDGVVRKWEVALEYCENLSLAGLTPWRLPDIKELESIVDITVHSPSINATFFSTTLGGHGRFWSSTTNGMYDDWYVLAGITGFYSGGVDWEEKGNYYFVRCVR